MIALILAAAVLSADFQKNPEQTGWTALPDSKFGETVVWTNQQAVTLFPVEKRYPTAGVRSSRFAVRPDQYYRVRFRATSEKPAWLALVFQDKQQQGLPGDYYTQIDPAPAGEWRQFDVQTKYPATSGFVQFQISSTPGLLTVDDVTVTPVRRKAVLQDAVRREAELASVPLDGVAARLEKLSRTLGKLRGRQPVRILFFGDSISNDLSNSPFDLLLEQRFPGARVEKRYNGRGGTGWAKFQNEVDTLVVPHKPDLIVMEAVSNTLMDLDKPLRSVIAQLRAKLPQTEILIVAPHMRTINHHTGKVTDEQRETLRALAAELELPFVDLMTVWDRALEKNGRPLDWLLRDLIHMNERGRLVSARALVNLLGETRPLDSK